jgi:hypothetical protein
MQSDLDSATVAKNKFLAGIAGKYGGRAVMDACYAVHNYPVELINTVAEATAISQFLISTKGF